MLYCYSYPMLNCYTITGLPMSIRPFPLAGLVGILSAGPLLAEVPLVAADIAPVHSLVARVMDGLGEPDLIVRGGASPHGAALRPSQAQALQEAQVMFWVGPELAPWLGEAAATLAPEARIVALLHAPGTTALEARTEPAFAAAEHGPDHAEEEGEHGGHGDGHGHDGLDPHAWLDPENGAAWLDAIAATLAEVDPENAARYAANAEAGRAEIAAAADRAESLLEAGPERRMVAVHDAYQYFERRFDLPAVGAIALSDASDPSPARVEEVRDLVRDRDVTCILAEPQFNRDLIRTVAEGTEAGTGIVDPLGQAIPTGPDFYPRLIVRIAEEIAGCGG